MPPVPVPIVPPELALAPAVEPPAEGDQTTWVAYGAVTLARALNARVIVIPTTSGLTARQVDDYFRSLDLVPSAVMEIDNIEAIKELVKLNLGVSVLAPWTADRELARGTLRMRPLGPKPLRRQWVVAWLKGRRLTLAEETFCKLCRNVAAGMRMDRKDL